MNRICACRAAPVSSSVVRTLETCKRAYGAAGEKCVGRISAMVIHEYISALEDSYTLSGSGRSVPSARAPPGGEYSRFASGTLETVSLLNHYSLATGPVRSATASVFGSRHGQGQPAF